VPRPRGPGLDPEPTQENPLVTKTRLIALCAAPALLFSLALAVAARPAEKFGPHLAHSVFFALKDRSPEARETFVASCQKYLTDHEGTISFDLGTMAEDVEEPGVSVRDFDVALLVVFESKEAEAKYLKAARHLSFVAENKAQFAKVRVFDSYLAPSKR